MLSVPCVLLLLWRLEEAGPGLLGWVCSGRREGFRDPALGLVVPAWQVNRGLGPSSVPWWGISRAMVFLWLLQGLDS